MSKLNKLKLLFVTAYPGISKIIILFTLTQVQGISITGYFAYKWGVIMLISLVSIDGFSVLLNGRIPSLKTNYEKQGAVVTLFLNGLLTLIILGFVWASLDGRFNYSDSLLMFSWFTYGFVRRSLIITRHYARIIVIDLVSLLVILIMIAKADMSGILLSCAFIGNLFIASIFILSRISFKSLKYTHLAFSTNGLVLGLNNALSGGLPLLILPIIASSYGDSIVAYISLIVSIVSVGLLVPRAVSLSYLSELGVKKEIPLELLQTYKKFDRTVLQFIGLFILLSPVLWAITAQYYLTVDILDINILLVYFSITFYLASSQLSLAPSCLFTVMERPSLVFNSNLVYFIASLALVFTIIESSGDQYFSVIVIFLSFSVFQITRAIYLRSRVFKGII